MLWFQSQRTHRPVTSASKTAPIYPAKDPKCPEQYLSVQRKVKVFVTRRFTLSERVVVSEEGGGVVQQEQDQVALIRSSHRPGQRCSWTYRPHSADKPQVNRGQRQRSGLKGRLIVRCAVSTMLLPSSALQLLLLAVLYSSLDLTWAEVSACTFLFSCDENLCVKKINRHRLRVHVTFCFYIK